MSDTTIARIAANGTEIAYAQAGQGEPVLLIHGSLSDYRYWTLQMRAFGANFRAIAPSLRHFYPATWSATGGPFNVRQNVEDLVAFMDALDMPAAHVVGHSRGGHVAFRLAQHHPSRVKKLVLSEPGGALAPDLSAHAEAVNRRFQPGSFQTQAVERIRAGDIDGGLRIFLDAVSGPGAWDATPPLAQQFTRDNATTLLGQIDEERQPFSREAAQAITAQTLLVLGGDSPPMFGQIIDALAAAIPDARKATIPGASHTMNVTKPQLYNEVVLGFLAGR